MQANIFHYSFLFKVCLMNLSSVLGLQNEPQYRLLGLWSWFYASSALINFLSLSCWKKLIGLDSLLPSFLDLGPHGTGRYSEHMLPEVEREDFRKGSQVWIDSDLAYVIIGLRNDSQLISICQELYKYHYACQKLVRLGVMNFFHLFQPKREKWK